MAHMDEPPGPALPPRGARHLGGRERPRGRPPAEGLGRRTRRRALPVRDGLGAAWPSSCSTCPTRSPLGSEYGGPGAFFFATIVLTIFSVAYVEMAKKVRAAGGMYTFVSLGLGRELGFMSGFSLLVAYVLFGGSLIGGFATFTQLKLDQYDIGIPWIWLALFGVAACVAPRVLRGRDLREGARRRAARRAGHHPDLLVRRAAAGRQRRPLGRADPAVERPSRASRRASASSSPSGPGSASRRRRTTPRSRATRCGSSRSRSTSRASPSACCTPSPRWAVLSSLRPEERGHRRRSAPAPPRFDGKTGASTPPR